jgi:cell division ATPase FtsA
MVDEFQDTNFAQYQLVKMLAGEKGNISVVGDDDQSIYKFRGASVSNILKFKDDFPKLEEITLIENYRSTKEILDLSYKFIQQNNPDRLEIKLQINKELKAINRDGKLPSGVVLTGGGSRLPEMAEFAKKHLRLPAALGLPQNINTVIDKVEDPGFATGVGLVLWGQKYGHGGLSAGNMFSSIKKVFSHPAAGKVKKWFKSFLP